MFQLGDIVWIDKELHETQENIVGRIIHISPYFTQIRTERGTLYTVHVTDNAKMHLMKKSKFTSYSEDAKNKDIRDALTEK